MLVLAVCKRGHIVNVREKGETVRTLAALAQYCSDCGAPVVRKCESCGFPIEWRRVVHSSAPPYLWQKERPDFCLHCNTPYPWASREKRIQQLYNWIDFEEGLDEAGRLEVIEQIAVLSQPDESEASEGRKIEAGRRLKQLAPKVVELGKDVLSELLVEAVWKGMNR